MKNQSKENTAVAMVAINEVYAELVKAVDGRPCKLNYSDAKSQPYCGYDDFSINMKKASYNVYMSSANADICIHTVKGLEVEDNPCDTTKKQLRCKLVKFTDWETLKKCIASVTANRFATN